MACVVFFNLDVVSSYRVLHAEDRTGNAYPLKMFEKSKFHRCILSMFKKSFQKPMSFCFMKLSFGN